MDNEKAKSKHDSRSSIWDTVVEYGKEHSIAAEANNDKYSLTGEEDLLSIIREKHIDWLRGQYEPTIEDFDLFVKDEDFYDSDLYAEYRREEVIEFSKRHNEIYNPSEEEVRRAALPFVDIIYKNADELSEVGAKFEIDRELGIETAVNFFSKCFGIEIPPRIEIVDNENDSDGSYRNYDNTLKINCACGIQTHKMLNTIAHEVWHAHQHACGDKRYEENFSHYFKASMDGSGYCNQLVEREAFLVGDEIENFYIKLRVPIVFAKMADDTEAIEKWNRRFDEWVDDKYSPPDSDEDDAWIKMAVGRMCHSGISLDDFSEEDPFDAREYCLNESYKEAHSALARDNYPPSKPKKGFLKQLFKNRKGLRK